jgi:TolB-like protein
MIFHKCSPPTPALPPRQALQAPEAERQAQAPFTNMSGDQEHAYLSDGISEDIITARSKLRCSS